MGWCCNVICSPSFPVVLLMFLTGCAQMGAIKSIGICLEDITEDLRTSSTDIGTAFGLFIAFSFIPAPIVAVLYRQRPLRRILLICGSCLITMGVMLISIATHTIFLSIFLSISGLGTCVVMTSSSIILSDFASPHFNLLYSIGMSGYGVGMVVLPFLAEMLRQSCGWRGSLLLLGALMGNVIPCAVAVRMSEVVGETHTDHQSSQDDTVSGDEVLPNRDGEIPNDVTESDSGESHTMETDPLVNDPGHTMETDPLVNDPTDSLYEISMDDDNELPKTFLRRLLDSFRTSDLYLDPVFNFIFLAIFFGAIVLCGWHAFLVPHALQRGLSIKETLIITVAAATSSVSVRVGVGLLCDKLFRPVSVYLLLTILNIGALLGDAFLPNFYVMVVTSCASAAAIAGSSVVSTLAVRDRASPDKTDVVFALDYFYYGIGSLLGGYLSGMVADVFSTYTAIFKLLAGIDVVVFFVLLIPWKIKKPSSN